jgi:homoserine kinase
VSRAALLCAALSSGDFELLRVASDDRIHQPYRAKIIPGMTDVFKLAQDNGALAVYLSGAGPTIIAIMKTRQLLQLPLGWTMRFLELELNGAIIELDSETSRKE